MAKLINGNGVVGITAQNDADLYEGIVGGIGVLNVGNNMAASVSDGSVIIADGACLLHGRLIVIESGKTDTCSDIPSTAGTYYLGYQISRDDNNVESASLFWYDSMSTFPESADYRTDPSVSTMQIYLYKVVRDSDGGLTLTSIHGRTPTLKGLQWSLPSADLLRLGGDGNGHELIVATGRANLANRTATNIDLSSYSFSKVILANACCNQDGFAAQANISSYVEDNTTLKLYQINSSNASMYVRWFVLGYRG